MKRSSSSGVEIHEGSIPVFTSLSGQRYVGKVFIDATYEGYDSSRYELLAGVFVSGCREAFNKFDPLPNRKRDVNKHGPFSSDNIGKNYGYPDGNYEQRQAIIQEHTL